MPLTREVRSSVETIFLRILEKRVETLPADASTVRNAPFHTVLLGAFSKDLEALTNDIPYLVAVGSWMHGLNTSLGSGFEAIAHCISGGKKVALRDYSPSRAMVEACNTILVRLDSRTAPHLMREGTALRKACGASPGRDPIDVTVDNLVVRGQVVDAVELKSVRPNKGEGRNEKRRILFGKAALMEKYPRASVSYSVGFPFDPTASKSTEFDKRRFLDHLIDFKRYFSPDEILLGPELWNHLSGTTHTMEELIDLAECAAATVASRPR